jgi:hypothetical protein
MTPTPQNDSIGRGVFYAVLWQIGAVVITIPLMCTIWGLVQWAALVPLYISQKKKGCRLTAKAVLITGFVDVLLNATRAALILGNWGNMH